MQQEPDKKPAAGGDASWLVLFCSARVAFSLIFMAYSAALPLLKDAWSMSASEAGMVQSAWHFGFLISLFAVGFLADRFGAKRTFLWSGVACSISGLVFAIFASDFISGAVLYGFAGLCSGGTYTPGLALVGERFPPAIRGRAMGFFLAAGSLGHTLSIVVSSLLFPVGGWRLAFLFTCSMPIVGLALSLYALRGTPNLVHVVPGSHEVWNAIRAVLKNRSAFLSMLAYAFHSWELLGMWAWLPAYLAAAAQAGAGSADLKDAAIRSAVLLSGLTYLTSMLGSVTGGALSDRWGRTRSMMLFSCVSLILSFSFGWMFGLPLVVLVLAAALYNLSAIADSSIYSTSLTELVEPKHIGAAYAVRSVMGFGAGVISPWVFGLVLDIVREVPFSTVRAGWGLAWMSLAVGALPGPLMIRFLRRRPEAVRMARGLR